MKLIPRKLIYTSTACSLAIREIYNYRTCFKRRRTPPRNREASILFYTIITIYPTPFPSLSYSVEDAINTENYK